MAESHAIAIMKQTIKKKNMKIKFLTSFLLLTVISFGQVTFPWQTPSQVLIPPSQKYNLFVNGSSSNTFWVKKSDNTIQSLSSLLGIVPGAATWGSINGTLTSQTDLNTALNARWMLNGNTVGSENWIGTIDNFALPFRTNNTEAFRIMAGGNIKISDGSTITDGSDNPAFSAFRKYIYNNTSDVTGDFASEQLLSGGSVKVDWSNSLLTVGSVLSFDWGNNKLYRGNSILAIDISSKSLQGTWNSDSCTWGSKSVWNGDKIGLLYGGTNSDLSATGGTSRVLKQTTVGGNISVAQLAASDLSNGTVGTGSVALTTATTTYTPTWSGSGTPPTIGNGTIVGSRTVISNVVIGHFELQTGATSTFGVGSTWTITLPETSTQANGTCLGNVYGFNSGVALYTGSLIQITTTTASIVSHANANFWGTSVPAVWVGLGASYIKGNFTYTK